MKHYKNFPFPLPLILDGSTGTQLMKRGMRPEDKTSDFVLENPEYLKELQISYIKSGSGAVYASTFGCAEFGRDIVPSDIARIASISREAAKDTALVGASLSPTGKFLYPAGDGDFEEIYDRYKKIVLSADPFVDFFVSETNIQASEARCALLAVKENSNKPCFVTVTVDENGRTVSGDALLPTFITLAHAGCDAFGVNCSFGAEKLISLLLPLVPYSVALDIPLIAKPNRSASGDEKDTAFIENMKALYRGGVMILGGCCGTGPEDIEALASLVKSESPSLPAASKEELSSLVSTTRYTADISDCETVECDEELDSSVMDCESDAVSVILKKGDAENVLSSLPYITKPLIFSGDADEFKLISRVYPGKTMFINS